MRFFSFTFIFFIPLFIFCQHERSAIWKSQHKHENRYEGLYSIKVLSNPAIELVSFLGQPFRYEFGKKQELFVDWYCPKPTEIFVKGEEIRVVHFYWMESENTAANSGWNQFGPWQVDKVLSRSLISHRDLGVLIQDFENRKKIYPAFIHQQNARKPSNRYIARFRLGTSISGGKFSVYASDKSIKSGHIQSGKIPAKSGGSSLPILIKIPPESDSQWFTVKIELTGSPHGHPIVYSFQFFYI